MDEASGFDIGHSATEEEFCEGRMRFREFRVSKPRFVKDTTDRQVFVVNNTAIVKQSAISSKESSKLRYVTGRLSKSSCFAFRVFGVDAVGEVTADERLEAGRDNSNDDTVCSPSDREALEFLCAFILNKVKMLQLMN